MMIDPCNLYRFLHKPGLGVVQPPGCFSLTEMEPLGIEKASVTGAANAMKLYGKTNSRSQFLPESIRKKVIQVEYKNYLDLIRQIESRIKN